MKVAGQQTKYFKLYQANSTFDFQFLGISFINHNGYSYIEFCIMHNEFSLASKDSIVLLFKDKTKLEFIFQKGGFGTKEQKMNIVTLTSTHLEIFLNKSLSKAKVISYRKNLYDIYILNHNDDLMQNKNYDNKLQYNSIESGQYLLRRMTHKFIELNLNKKI